MQLPQLESLKLGLSALTTAMRIQYNLFRTTRFKPMSGLQAYKRKLNVTYIVSHTKRMHRLFVQEFARLQDSTVSHLQSSERVIVEHPVDIEYITEPYHSDESTFFTIC